MSMDLAVKTFSTEPDYLIAGPAPISTGTKTAAADLQRGAPVILDGNGKLAAVPVASGKPTTTGLYGILAEDCKTGETGIVYLSGEFFADALVLPEGITAAAMEIALRNLGIFLK